MILPVLPSCHEPEYEHAQHREPKEAGQCSEQVEPASELHSVFDCRHAFSPRACGLGAALRLYTKTSVCAVPNRSRSRYAQSVLDPKTKALALEIGRRVRLHRQARPAKPSATRQRRSKKLSIEGLAEEAKLSTDFLTKLESGRYMPSVATIFQIAHALDVEPVELLPPTPARSPEKQRALDELRAYANRFSVAEIRHIAEVARATMKRPAAAPRRKK